MGWGSDWRERDGPPVSAPLQGELRVTLDPVGFYPTWDDERPPPGRFLKL